MSDAAKKTFELFRGHSGGHGTYGHEEKSPGKLKSEIKKTAKTLRQPPTVELWEEHLEGRRKRWLGFHLCIGLTHAFH